MKDFWKGSVIMEATKKTLAEAGTRFGAFQIRASSKGGIAFPRPFICLCRR